MRSSLNHTLASLRINGMAGTAPMIVPVQHAANDFKFDFKSISLSRFAQALYFSEGQNHFGKMEYSTFSNFLSAPISINKATKTSIDFSARQNIASTDGYTGVYHCVFRSCTVSSTTSWDNMSGGGLHVSLSSGSFTVQETGFYSCTASAGYCGSYYISAPTIILNTVCVGSSYAIKSAASSYVVGTTITYNLSMVYASGAKSLTSQHISTSIRATTTTTATNNNFTGNYILNHFGAVDIYGSTTVSMTYATINGCSGKTIMGMIGWNSGDILQYSNIVNSVTGSSSASSPVALIYFVSSTTSVPNVKNCYFTGNAAAGYYMTYCSTGYINFVSCYISNDQDASLFTRAGVTESGDVYTTKVVTISVASLPQYKCYYDTATNGFSKSKTFTASHTFTPSHTFTASKTFTASHTFTPSHTFTASKSFTPSHTFTASKSFTPSHTFTASKSFTPSHTFTASMSFTPSHTFTASKSFTPSHSFTASHSFSPSKFFSNSFSASSTFTESHTFSASNHFTPSKDFSASKSFTPTPKFSESDTFTASHSFSGSHQFSASDSFTASKSFSPSNTQIPAAVEMYVGSRKRLFPVLVAALAIVA